MPMAPHNLGPLAAAHLNKWSTMEHYAEAK